MPFYACTFITVEGKYAKREIYAESKKDLREHAALGDDKLISVHRRIFREVSFLRLFGRRVGYHQFLLFNQELVTLLRAGIPVTQALDIIIESSKPSRLQSLVKKAAADINSGVQISEAFSSHDLPYQRIYQASLLAGEKSGHLETVLEKFNAYLGKMANLRTKTISSLTYPAVLLGFMGTMFLVISLFVIPKFSSMYEQFDASLPSITLFFLEVTAFFKDNIVWIAVVLALSFIGIKLLERYNSRIVIIDKIKMRFPFVGRVILENSMAIFARTLSVLVSGGIPIPESSIIAVDSLSNRHLHSLMQPVPQSIREGHTLSEALGRVALMPRIMLEMIRVGETSGNLVSVLDESADYYERAIDTKMSTLISLIEPVIIITLGVVIAVMLISVYLPIFSAIRVAQ